MLLKKHLSSRSGPYPEFNFQGCGQKYIIMITFLICCSLRKACRLIFHSWLYLLGSGKRFHTWFWTTAAAAVKCWIKGEAEAGDQWLRLSVNYRNEIKTHSETRSNKGTDMHTHSVWMASRWLFSAKALYCPWLHPKKWSYFATVVAFFQTK